MGKNSKRNKKRREVKEIVEMSELINYDVMKAICLANIADFGKLPGMVTDTTTMGRTFYRDNGASVLAIAHLDTVQNLTHFKHVDLTDVHHGNKVYNAQLDDRLGAYVILDVLPKLGINVDVLLTEGEETGQSTGAMFDTPSGKEWNWMFQFDRAGHDVVMYDYETPALRALLLKAKLQVGIGSFSDIASMEHLGIAGFNFGVGYHDNHGISSYADMDETIAMLRGFVRFYLDNKDTKLAHVHVERKAYSGYYWEKQADGSWRAGASKYLPSAADTKLDGKWEDDTWVHTDNSTALDDYLCDYCQADCWHTTDDELCWEQFGLCYKCTEMKAKAESDYKSTKRLGRMECKYCTLPIEPNDVAADLENELCGACVNWIEKSTGGK